MKQQIARDRDKSKRDIPQNALRRLDNQEEALERLRKFLQEGERSGMMPCDFAEICAELD